MSVFERAKNKVKELKSSVNPTIQSVFEEYKELVKEVNVDRQLFDKGQDSKGSIIRPAYKPITIKLKKKKGQPADRVTLRDTGKFHRTLKVIPKDDEVEIIAGVEYGKYLIKKYGDDILGLQEEFLREFITRYILPELKKTFDDKIARP